MISCRLPLCAAAIARSNSVCSACAQGIVAAPRAASTSATPARTAEVPGVVKTTWIRRSASKTGSTSASRVAAVTVWTITSTVRAG
ncbi:hypothetical protein [Fodinicola feengrottensis]|uniref:hypothetical protein n=1 Tax=Fodinicola feengrottensis TaxID=435914 RepID=UPI0031E25DE2